MLLEVGLERFDAFGRYFGTKLRNYETMKLRLGQAILTGPGHFDMTQCPGLWCGRNVIFLPLFRNVWWLAELIYFGAVVQLTTLQQFCRYDVYE